MSKRVVADFLRILTSGMAAKPASDRPAAENTGSLDAIATRLEQVTTRLEQAAFGAAGPDLDANQT